MNIYTITITYYENEKELYIGEPIEYVSGYRYVSDSYNSLEKAKESGMEILKRHIFNFAKEIELKKDICFEELQDLATNDTIVGWICELDILERKLIKGEN